jgi:hypothetical protein
MNTATPTTHAATPSANSPESKKIILKDIGAKWSKFSETELGALKTNDELVSQVVAKYSLDKAQARRDVDAVMKGRHLHA